MSTHPEEAQALFREGYNCAQSVFAAFCDRTGLPRETALALSSSFGGGMGRLREVCGAVSGMFMAAGMLYGRFGPRDSAAKTAHNRRVQELAARFRAQNGSILCRELLGVGADGSPVPTPRGAEFFQKRPCAELVGFSARLLDEYIAEHPPEKE